MTRVMAVMYVIVDGVLWLQGIVASDMVIFHVVVGRLFWMCRWLTTTGC